jgi:hypothetical protein
VAVAHYAIPPRNFNEEVEDMDEKKKTIYLPCTMTDPEIVESAKKMAERLSKLDQLEDQLASVKKQIGADVDACNAQIAKLKDMVRTGIEHRDVQCTVRYEWKRGKKITQRDDTGEIVVEEVISEGERQQNLLDDQKRAAARVQ